MLAGSDRQARGRILHVLRGSDIPVPAAVIAGLAADTEQLDRALAGLLVDGLAVGDAAHGYSLPTS